MIRLVIVNPYSGNKRGDKYAKTIQKIFDNLKNDGDIADDNIFIEYTEYEGHAKEIVLEYQIKYKNKEIVVYVVGGDGTLSEVGTAIINKENISMIVIPKGTGNDFSKAVNEYRSIRKIIKSSIKNQPEKVDSILIKHKVAMNMIDSGLDAAIAANLIHFRKIPFVSGKMKYKLAILYTVFLPKTYKLKIRVDDNIFKGKYTLIAIGNNKFCGGGVNMLPHANIQDGKLDICIIKSITLLQKIKYLPKLMRGKHENLPIVKMLSGKRIAVSSGKTMPVSIDGEIIYTRGFIAKIAEKSVSVIKTLDK